MPSLLRITLLISVMFASLLAGVDGSLVLRTTGQDIDCGMECCQPTEEATSCCSSEEPEVVLVSPCGCKGDLPSAVLELNRIDWAPTSAEPNADYALAGGLCADVFEVPESRAPMPETAPPRV